MQVSTIRRLVGSDHAVAMASDLSRGLALAVGVLPAAIVGALLHGFIKGVLFNVWIVCTMLIVGGGVLLWVDRVKFTPR